MQRSRATPHQTSVADRQPDSVQINYQDFGIRAKLYDLGPERDAKNNSRPDSFRGRTVPHGKGAGVRLLQEFGGLSGCSYLPGRRGRERWHVYHSECTCADVERLLELTCQQCVLRFTVSSLTTQNSHSHPPADTHDDKPWRGAVYDIVLTIPTDTVSHTTLNHLVILTQDMKTMFPDDFQKDVEFNNLDIINTDGGVSINASFAVEFLSYF